MHTDKTQMVRGLKFLGYTVLLMFSAPFAIYQAFKNQEHPLYLPVLILGLVLAISAIALGFYGIKVIMQALFNTKK
tara:strand:- start:730 stop:957 length:228 start_codon:yes stop_codon:yes gene_type:complete